MEKKENDLGLKGQDYMLVEALIKVAAIERLMIKNGLISAQDIEREIKSVSEEIIKYMQNSSQITNGELK